MLKRKYGSRPEWKRIKERDVTHLYVSDEFFKGYISLLVMNEVKQPLNLHYGDKKICIADQGYCWLQQFPDDANYSITTMFDQKGQPIQWYVDICKQNGFSEEHGPYMDDLFLDLILLSTGEIIEKDAEELEEALKLNVIDEEDYQLAWREFTRMKTLLQENSGDLKNHSVTYKELLLNKLTLKNQP